MNFDVRRWLLASWVLILITVSACSGGDSDTGNDDDNAQGASCSTVTNVSNGPTTDTAPASNATTLICYYASPNEGYCRKITDASSVNAYKNGGTKAGLGCGSAIVYEGGDCPTQNAVGRCSNTSIEAERVYYTCSKFSDPQKNCQDISGTYTAL